LKATNENLSVLLIARRRYLRGGVRFFHRGIDDKADVANFCELEVILLYNTTEDYRKVTHAYSYSQIRGSCPFYWTQVTREGKKEKVKIMEE
jgi:hypothetical protein